MYRYFKRIASVGSGNYVYFCKSKGLSDEGINSNTASNIVKSKIQWNLFKAR